MNPAQRNQLKHLDRSIAALLDERARLVRQVASDDARPAVEDILRRSSGDFPAQTLRAVFELIDGAARGAQTS